MATEQLERFFTQSLGKYADARSDEFRYVVNVLALQLTNAHPPVLEREEDAIAIKALRLRGERPALAALEYRVLGDELLFLTGFFPERLTNAYRRKPIGLDYYVEMGKLSYDAAAVATSRHVPAQARLLEGMASHFGYWTGKLLNLRADADHANGAGLLDERTASLIKRATATDLNALRLRRFGPYRN